MTSSMRSSRTSAPRGSKAQSEQLAFVVFHFVVFHFYLHNICTARLRMTPAWLSVAVWLVLACAQPRRGVQAPPDCTLTGLRGPLCGLRCVVHAPTAFSSGLVPACRPVIPTVRGRAGGRHWRQLEEAVAADPKAAAAKLFSKVCCCG